MITFYPSQKCKSGFSSRRPRLLILAQRGSLRPNSIVLRIVLKLAKAKRLHQWRNVNANAPAKALLETIPTFNGILRGATPGFNRSFFGRFLLVRPAKLDPIPGSFEHGMKIVDASRIVEQNRFPDRANENANPIFFIDVHRIRRRSRRRLELPGIGFGSIELWHMSHHKSRNILTRRRTRSCRQMSTYLPCQREEANRFRFNWAFARGCQHAEHASSAAISSPRFLPLAAHALAASRSALRDDSMIAEASHSRTRPE